MAWRKNLAATKQRNSRRKKLNAVLTASSYPNRGRLASHGTGPRPSLPFFLVPKLRLRTSLGVTRASREPAAVGHTTTRLLTGKVLIVGGAAIDVLLKTIPHWFNMPSSMRLLDPKAWKIAHQCQQRKYWFFPSPIYSSLGLKKSLPLVYFFFKNHEVLRVLNC